jgi:CO/xanthine dehydrogenase Mo-binding subunit
MKRPPSMRLNFSQLRVHQCVSEYRTKVLIEMIDRPGETSWGAGEPTATAIPAAIANAIYDATGARLRSVPITPEKVKAAMLQTA